MPGRDHFFAETRIFRTPPEHRPAVADWIAAQNAAGAFPEWEGGSVTGVTPTLTGAPVACGAGAARYQIQIRVTYVVVSG